MTVFPVHYTLIPVHIDTVEGIGSYMQRPFVNNRNVISMDAMTRVIEMDLQDAIGETDFPERIEPINGALY